MKHEGESTIGGVPVNSREECKYQLLDSIRYRPDNNYRVPLLCNAASRGWGKTVLQAFNMHWFTQETNGIAVEVTFNDDQESLCVEGYHINSVHAFLSEIAIRIIHRVVAYYTSNAEADILCEDEHMVQLVKALHNPLTTMVKLLPSLLQAPDDSKIMIAVDEISKAPDIMNRKTKPSRLLRILADAMDVTPTLYLSVTSYGASDLTEWNRPLLYQSLTPLWNIGYSSADIESLPMILQPFYNQELRSQLPRDVPSLSLYSEIAEWIIWCGGVGRRTQYLYNILRRFDGYGKPHLEELKKSKTMAAGSEFVKSVLEWLTPDNRRMIAKSMNGMEFPSEWEIFGRKETKIVESIAIDAACGFEMPSDKFSVRLHKTSLLGTETGHCSYFSNRNGEMLAYIPPAVLQTLPLTELKPCGTALSLMSHAISDFYQMAIDRKTHKQRQCSKEKVWEDIAATSMLLFARSNPYFTVKDLCQIDSCGHELGEVTLVGGESIQYDVMSIDLFPSENINVTMSILKNIVNDLIKYKSHGVIFTPMNRTNKVGDFYGLFRTKNNHCYDFVLLVVQCKNWLESSQQADVRAAWEKNRELINDEMTLDIEVLAKKARVELVDNEKEVKVRVMHLLFQSNDLPIDVKENEGVITTTSMRKWLPTAAYAFESADQLNRIFDFNDQPVEESS